jgi:hypothetical protein
MKTWKQRALSPVAAILAIFAVVFIGCPTSDGEHTHQWGEWQVITTPTCTTEGEETRTCTIDATHKETRPIAALGHDWGNWIQITAPSYTIEGEETRTCTHDATHTETRSISRIPFTSVADLGTWLTNQPDNTKDTPYNIALNIDEDDFPALLTTLYGEANKYVYLDLSGSTITAIPDFAFINDSTWKECTTLIGITIPNTVTSIGESAFDTCINLTSAIIPNGVTTIGDFAFYSCAALPCVTIPDSVTNIGRNAFGDCTSLTSVTIPSSVTSIGIYAFIQCTSLAAINVDVSNSAYTSLEGVL